MTYITRDRNSYTQDSTQARFIACPDGQTLTITSTGGTLYYKSTSDVTSGASDGNITTGNSAALTAGVWVITAQGVSTRVDTVVTEGITGDLRVGGNLTIVGNSVTGGTSSGSSTYQAPLAIPNWWPSVVTSGTDTTPADGTLFLTSIIPTVNFTATGVGYVIGSVGGTNRVVVNLWSAAGVNLAQSTTTADGTVCGTTATYQQIAFTATYAVKARTLYYVGVAAKGNTCRLRTVPVGADLGTIYAGSVSQTHGATTTIATPPTTFTADKAPVCFLY